MKECICIVCPQGCHLQVDEQNNYRVTGNACPRGEEYGRAELKSPMRTVTSTVRMSCGPHRRCPVKTDRPIPKHLIFDAVALLCNVELQSPVRLGQVVVKNVCGTGANFVATRNL